MFTSRAEYRLLLREDNADQRLTPIGRERGLVSDEHFALFTKKQKILQEILTLLQENTIRPDAKTKAILEEMNEAAPTKAITLEDLCRRPNMQLKDIAKFLPELAKYLTAYPEICETAEIITKYSGYLSRQEEIVQKTANQEKNTPAKGFGLYGHAGAFP